MSEVHFWLACEAVKSCSSRLGAIARDFEAIDKRGAGRVSFEDYKQYLRTRGAAFN